MTQSLFLSVLKPNCNIKIQKPYRKLLFANSKRSRKREANPCDFERTLCLNYLIMSYFTKRTVRTSYIVLSTETHFFVGEGGGGWRLFEGERLLQILGLRRGANSIYIVFSKVKKFFGNVSTHKSLVFCFRYLLYIFQIDLITFPVRS